MEQITYLNKPISYVRCGSGQPLIMVHSGLMSSMMFRGLAWLYADHFDLIIPDMPGRGISARYDGENMPERELWAGAIAALADSLELKNPAVMGVGLGASAALLCAMKNSGCFSFALLDSIPGRTPGEHWKKVRADREDTLKNEGACEFLTGLHGADYADVAMRDASHAELMCALKQEAWSGLPDPDCRVVFAASHEDELDSESVSAAEDWAKNIKKGETLIFDTGKNPCCMSNSKAVLDRLIALKNGK